MIPNNFCPGAGAAGRAARGAGFSINYFRKRKMGKKAAGVQQVHYTRTHLHTSHMDMDTWTWTWTWTWGPAGMR